jgi:hypothetical protein
MYHRNHKVLGNSFKRIIKTPEEAIEKVKELAVDFQICKHGARKGLCRMGCT